MNTNVVLLQASSGNVGAIGFIVLAVAIAVVFFRWFFKLLTRVNDLVPLLTEDPDTYIQEMELILKGMIPKGFKSMLIMNIAVAHIQKNDYPAALQTMGRVKSMRLRKDNAAVYFLNLAHIYVQLGDNKKAFAIFKGNEKKFNKLPMGGNLPRLNAFMKAFAFMETEKWDEAQEILEYVKASWSEPVPGVDFAILHERMEAHLQEV